MLSQLGTITSMVRGGLGMYKGGGGCSFPVSTAHFLILVTVKVEGTLVIRMTCQYFVQLAWSINYFYPRFTIPYTSFSMLLINNML